MTILVIGASGAVGLPTVRHLIKRGAKVRALSSKESSAVNLKSLGVAETVIGDVANDADVKRAFAGVTSVMHIPPRFREDEAKIGLRVLKAAVEATAAAFGEELRRHNLPPVVTEMRPASEAGAFWYAEDYHQQYLHKNPGGYCNHGPNGLTCQVGILRQDEVPSQESVLGRDA